MHDCNDNAGILLNSEEHGKRKTLQKLPAGGKQDGSYLAADVGHSLRGGAASISVVLVSVEPPVQFGPLLRRQGKCLLISRNTVPQVLDESDALLDGKRMEIWVHGRLRFTNKCLAFSISQ